jgi:type I restriction-modification system DNA methylase subunit
LLNKRFYRELANWYFWALPQVNFPADIEKDDEKRRATGLIRLLTRLIFCWFLKEKGLVPEELFAEADLRRILKDLSPNASTYNEAILQNLFFATLNQRMGKDAKGQPYRAFAKDEGFQKNRTTYGVDTLYRYEDHFRDPDTALGHFADVPFLNGGLFECLDRTEEGTDKKLYLDGFSRNKKKRPIIPNNLFFSGEHEEDLSGAYGDTKRRKEKVRGLLHILNAYKFTIVENTPVDQEIALDPELLGKVFENLLASYNEETRTTARKQTGSFYTPRPIVEYMVDESLKAHLAGVLATAGMNEQNAKIGLDILFAYTEREHPFNEKEVATLLDAIHTSKILDPACGSGAFPMGMLHKLVYIIHRLDPDNTRWMQLQIDAAANIPDYSARDAAIAAIERVFADNEDDYARKLYLIENCLYGVDIQPIAIQISKLRFFISLVCDQRTNRNKRENHGIRPLPNLETKFVAANTLIRLPEQLALLPPRVHQIESEIESLYHRHFSVQRRDEKLSLQKKIKELREELGKVLSESLGSSKKAQHIADWDPFDPQTVAGFFDPFWMFGRSLGEGFDIVIGNPPYVSYGLRGVGTLTKQERDELVTQFPNSAEYKISVYAIFMERCISLSKKAALSTLIVPDSFLLGKYFSKIRNYILRVCMIRRLVLIKERVFDNVTVGQSVIYLFQRQSPAADFLVHVALGTEEAFLRHADYLLSEQCYFSSQPRSRFRLFFDDITKGIIQEIDSISHAGPLSSLVTFRSGLIAKAGQATIQGFEQRGKFWAPGISSGGMVKRYLVKYEGEYLCFEPAQIKSGGIGTVNYKDPKLFVRQTGDSIICGYDGSGLLALNNVHIGEGVTPTPDRLMYVCAVLNSSVVKFYYRATTLEEGRALSQIDIDMLDEIPIALPTSDSERSVATLVRSAILVQNFAENAEYQFIEDLIDACVMECYFHDHMAERDLLFLDDLAPHLAVYDSGAPESQQREFIEQLYTTLNAPTSKIRNRLLRISADSPDLLAVIKAEGKA